MRLSESPAENPNHKTQIPKIVFIGILGLDFETIVVIYFSNH